MGLRGRRGIFKLVKAAYVLGGGLTGGISRGEQGANSSVLIGCFLSSVFGLFFLFNKGQKKERDLGLAGRDERDVI